MCHVAQDDENLTASRSAKRRDFAASDMAASSPWEGMLEQAVSQGLHGETPSPPTPVGLDDLFLSPPPKISLVPQAGEQQQQQPSSTEQQQPLEPETQQLVIPPMVAIAAEDAADNLLDVREQSVAFERKSQDCRVFKLL